MRNLLNFIIRFSSWFVFAFLAATSCVLIVRGNTYQQSVYLTSANAVTSGVNSAVSEVDAYFGLRDANRRLEEENAKLQAEVFNLRNDIAYLSTQIPDTTHTHAADRFGYVAATVINNSTRFPRNYFTINKGRADGVEPGMGVANHDGVVGIVNVVGEHTARVISVLSRGQNFSVRLNGSEFVGSLTWRGNDPTVAVMEEVPRHARFHIGDTVVTSGFSTTFPEGIPLGTVISRVRGRDENFFTLKVRLAPNFRTLGAVRVISDGLMNELDSLRSFDAEEDKRL